jgi:hypothetical protein
MQDTISKIENSIQNLENKSSRTYFFVQDTKGNARASVKYIYEMAKTLKEGGYNPIILTEKNDYFSVQTWLGEEYSSLPHKSVEGQNLEISPEDTIIVPEIFGYIMTQLTNLPCAKIVLCQAYDHIFETLQPGQSWAQLGFTKCITTSQKQKEYISSIMRNVSIDVVEPLISDKFEPSELPVKPIITVHSREQRETINLIKTFYQKYPQYRWVNFRDMRGLSESDFANALKDSIVSIWMDLTGGFGTYPLESMKCNVPVIGIVPNMMPEWMSENNGLWLQESLKIVDVIAEYIQNWLEDNVSEELYTNGRETSKKYSNLNLHSDKITSLFQGFSQIRINNFQQELNKLSTVEN